MKRLVERIEDLVSDAGSIELTEGKQLTKGDKQVLRAFSDQKSAESKKLSTDGKRLDGLWMGGRGIAEWKGDKVHFNDLGSRAAQTIQRALAKTYIAKFDLAEDVEDEDYDEISTADFDELEEGRTYYALVGRKRARGPWEQVHIGTNKKAAEKKKREHRDDYVEMEVVPTDDPNKADIVDYDRNKTRGKYYVLVGKASKEDPFEVIFGAFDREDVVYEKDGERGNWKQMKIVKVASGEQSVLDKLLAGLNEDFDGDDMGELDESFKDSLGARHMDVHRQFMREAAEKIDKATGKNGTAELSTSLPEGSVEYEGYDALGNELVAMIMWYYKGGYATATVKYSSQPGRPIHGKTLEQKFSVAAFTPQKLVDMFMAVFNGKK